MKNRLMLIGLLASSLTMSGCSLMAPKYSASTENVQKLKDAASLSVKVGAFESTPGKDNANPISIRGSQLASPYDGSYANYLAEALRQELSIAGKLAPDATLEISGALQKNDMNIPALGNGTGDIAARFVVKRGGEVRYDQIKSISDSWESSFAGPVAIPRAVEHYPILVQKLLSSLYADPAFAQALK